MCKLLCNISILKSVSKVKRAGNILRHFMMKGDLKKLNSDHLERGMLVWSVSEYGLHGRGRALFPIWEQRFVNLAGYIHHIYRTFHVSTKQTEIWGPDYEDYREYNVTIRTPVTEQINVPWVSITEKLSVGNYRFLCVQIIPEGAKCLGIQQISSSPQL